MQPESSTHTSTILIASLVIMAVILVGVVIAYNHQGGTAVVSSYSTTPSPTSTVTTPTPSASAEATPAPAAKASSSAAITNAPVSFSSDLNSIDASLGKSDDSLNKANSAPADTNDLDN